MRHKDNAPTRSAMDVGRGDYVKIGSSWHKIASNTAHGQEYTPRNWTVQTEDGHTVDMWGVKLYAKAEDIE